jgi:hypothetical protein
MGGGVAGTDCALAVRGEASVDRNAAVTAMWCVCLIDLSPKKVRARSRRFAKIRDSLGWCSIVSDN